MEMDALMTDDVRGTPRCAMILRRHSDSFAARQLQRLVQRVRGGDIFVVVNERRGAVEGTGHCIGAYAGAQIRDKLISVGVFSLSALQRLFAQCQALAEHLWPEQAGSFRECFVATDVELAGKNLLKYKIGVLDYLNAARLFDRKLPYLPQTRYVQTLANKAQRTCRNQRVARH
jgi:hypothetical protein